jgi:nitrite reductase (NADH) small subunit
MSEHTAGTPSTAARAPEWIEAATTKELQRRRTLVVEHPSGDVVVGWHDGRPFAMANICVHRKRELARGMIFQDRLVCPGHQWAFDLETGYCAERERSQPVFATRVDGDIVFVDVSGPVWPVPEQGDEASPAEPSH